MPGQFEVSPIPDEMGVGTRVDRCKGVCTLIPTRILLAPHAYVTRTGSFLRAAVDKFDFYSVCSYV